MKKKEKLEAINWNKPDDPKDAEVWDRLTANFWLPEKVPLSNDIPSWRTLTPDQKDTYTKVFANLTLLDTLQGTIGAPSMIPDAITLHEEAVLTNMSFMECLSGDHELLTPTGWKPISGITKEDTIAQWNSVEDVIEFTKPLEISEYDAPKTYLISSLDGFVDQHVSPNHRVVVQRRSFDDSDSGDLSEWTTHVVLAEDLTLDDLTPDTRIPNTARTSIIGAGLSEEQRLALRKHPMSFAKHLDLSTLTIAGAWEIMHEMFEWTTEGYSRVHANNKETVDFLSAVATLAGCRSKMNKISYDEDTHLYSITVAKEIRATNGRSIAVSQQSGCKVYGVEVPSSYLVTRSDGAVSITGNSVHAKSYSSIFSTLLTSEEISEAFAWAEENEMLQKKAQIIRDYYIEDDSEKKKIASVMLESFLFYSGFYYALYWSAMGKLTNSADIIRLILRDEAVHGYYLGYKFKLAYDAATPERQKELYDFTHNLLRELMENEIAFTKFLYDSVSLTEDVLKFLNYNANKALMNLGFEAIFSPEEINASPSILSSLSPIANENHDFFSGSGSSYVLGDVVETEDDDWDF